MRKNKWYLIIKIILTILSGFMSLLLKCKIDWPNCLNIISIIIEPQLFKDTIYDISIGIFSSMVLVWFIDEIGNHIEENQSQKKEYETIIRLDKILQKYLLEYEKAFYCAVTPIEDRENNKSLMPSDFTLENMKDLFKPSFMTNHGIFEPTVFAFLRIELELRHELINIIKQYPFNYYSDFSDLFMKYIEISLAHDYRSTILDTPNRMINQKEMTELISELLSTDAEKYINLPANKQNNIMLPYIKLYEMMKEERNIILQYKELLKNINTTK